MTTPLWNADNHDGRFRKMVVAASISAVTNDNAITAGLFGVVLTEKE
jgi:hypothetical protein